MPRSARVSSIAPLAMVLALVAGLLAAVPAHAADVEFDVATITVSPSYGYSGNPHFLESIAVSTGGPAGFRTSSGTYVFQEDVLMGSIAEVRTGSTPAEFGTFGLDGSASYADRSVVDSNPFVSNRALSELDIPLASGQFELRYYWSGSAVPNLATDPYASLLFDFNRNDGLWMAYAPARPTSLSVTGGSTGDTVRITTTVKSADGTEVLEGAVGDLRVFEGSTPVAGGSVGYWDVGPTTLTFSGVSEGLHTYTVTFEPYDFYSYLPSTSGPVTVNAGGSESLGTIVVAVPSGVGSLTLSGTSGDVDLGTAALVGGTLNASGTLTATVTDTRQIGSPRWSLTGQVGDFQTGSHLFDGKYLGWTPVLLPSSTAGLSIAGSAVLPATPATGSGLTSVSALASGEPNLAGDTTNVSALLQLKAPRSTRSGDYLATLTVTLV